MIRSVLRRPVCASIVLAASGIALASGRLPLHAQGKQQQVFLSLVGPDGAPVTDLQDDDVMIAEDGVPCKTTRVEPINWPMKITLLIDNGPVTSNPLTNLRTGVKALIGQLPNGVETALYTTAPNPRQVVRATMDKQKLIAGVDLISPESAGGAFFDALSEAANRIEKDNGEYFPVLMMLGSDYGRLNVQDRDFERLQKTILARAITVHIVLLAGGGDPLVSVAGATQTEVGLAVTKLSGGRYENIASNTRLTTLLPEFGKMIAKSHVRQSHQYRIVYERPANAKAAPAISASVTKPGKAMLTVDGHIPQPQ